MYAAPSTMSPAQKLEHVCRFIRAHDLQALSICGYVHFECADGHQHKVRSMAEAREILGY
jgi:hypothetical protein